MSHRVAAALACCCLWSCPAPAETKGCFLPGVEVSMADGTVRPLQDVRVGDAVLSWDNDAQSLAPSLVRAVPTYLRNASELVEITLPHAVLHATEDHPFWSRSKRGLVSISPNQTMAEYGLQAGVFDVSEELERHLDGAVHGVAARWQRPVSLDAALRGRRMADVAAGAGAVEVMTLCLEPLHWFYVHGVRVHNKGCFVKTSEVSMAGGPRKQIQEVRVGDEVLSWDESRQQVARSTVMVVPTYLRDAAELVEITLPHAKLHATDDHPFWSKSRQGLVSVHPERTKQEYELLAQSLAAGEIFEDERSEGVPVSGVRRLPGLPAPQHPLRGRRLAGGNGSGSEVEVMTLCLHPHHWFYVHGVRVHNKGCFAPWVRVLLSNGSQVPIAAVQPGDLVASWDTGSEAAVAASVRSVERFAPGELYEMATVGAASGEAFRRLAGEQGRGLVFTADHPIYSARQQGLVSMRPNATASSYGIAVGQMLALELVSDHTGRSVEASVQPWQGEQPPVVMTLHLGGHHWFYAEGVRVHNKGFGGGGGFHGSSGPTYRYRSSYSSRTAFSVYVMTHDRRRRGVWSSSGDCNYNSQADGGGGALYASTVCTSTVGNMNACSRCDQCTTESCIQSIPGCPGFLGELYSRCRDGSGFGDSFGIVFIGSIFGLVCCCAIAKKNQSPNAAELAQLKEQRVQLEASPANGPGLSSTQWQGHYSENGESKPTQYQWSASPEGRITGQTFDDDGPAQVSGAIQWLQGQDSGTIAWVEQGPNMFLEANGRICFLQQEQQSSWWPSMSSSERPMKIEATYSSSLGVSGCVNLWMGTPPVPPGGMPPAGAAVPMQNMGAPGALQNYAGQDKQPLLGA